MTGIGERLRLSVGRILHRGAHIYWRFSRGMTLGVRGLVINDRDEIFLIRHSYVAGWQLPGGGVEPGETLLEALARELMEEGNIAVTDTPPLHAIYFQPSVSRRDHVALFVVKGFRQATPPVPNREIIAHGFFPRDALPNDTTQGTRRRIAEVFDGTPTGTRW